MGPRTAGWSLGVDEVAARDSEDRAVGEHLVELVAVATWPPGDGVLGVNDGCGDSGARRRGRVVHKVVFQRDVAFFAEMVRILDPAFPPPGAERSGRRDCRKILESPP